MRRILTYLLAAMMLCGCAAEKRLAHLLAMHPELQHLDTTYRDRYIFLPGEQNSITLTIEQLKQLDQEATQSRQENQQGQDPQPAITTRTSRSQATVSAQGNGILNLQTIAPPDTIVVHDTVYQPAFITRTQYKDRIIYQPNAFQSFLCYIGAIALLIFFLRTLINTLRR